MDLPSLERACEMVLSGASGGDTASAHSQLMALSASTDSMRVIQAILDGSMNSAAIMVACNSLLTLATEHWNSFSEPQRIDIRNYILDMLAKKGPSLAQYAITAAARLVVRITKLGWFDEPPLLRAIVTETKKFLSATVYHSIIGLRVLVELVTEMNQRNKNRTLTQQRKVAVAFRDQSLLEVFEVSLGILNQVATRSLPVEVLAPAEATVVEDTILRLALELLRACLSFDFIGANPDESSEELGTLQVPASWKDRVQSGASMRMLFNLYKGLTTGRISIIPDAPAPVIGAQTGGTDAAASAAMAMMTREMPVSGKRAAETLDALSLIVSVRRNLFTSDTERKRFLNHILRGLVEIMRDRPGLNDVDLHHQFSRLLSKIKLTYQLEDLVKTEGYPEWIAQLARFTIDTLAKPMDYSNSLPYLLGLWSRLVASVPYLRSTSGASVSGSAAVAAPLDPLLDAFVPQVVGAYVRGRIDSIMGDRATEALEEIEDLDNLEDELDALPAICRFAYDASVTTIVSVIDPLLAQYQEYDAIVKAQGVTPQSETVLVAMHVLECRLSWLVAIIGAIVGGAGGGSGGIVVGSYYIASTGAPIQSGEEQFDAELCRRVLSLMNLIETRIAAASAGMHPTAAAQNVVVRALRADARLELAFLYFVANFRKAYVSESSGVPQTAVETRPAITAGNPFSKTLSASHGSSLMANVSNASKMDTDMTGPGTNTPTTLEELAESATGRQKIFYNLFLRMQLGTHVQVITMLINKLANNLRLYAQHENIINRTLDVFNDLVYSYASARLLLSLDAVGTLLTHHTSEHFPFLAVPANSRHRTYFYSALARLVFVEDESDVRSAHAPAFQLEFLYHLMCRMEDHVQKLDPFLAPILLTLDNLALHVHLRNQEVMHTVIGAARDLRGIFTAANNRANYVALFEALYPKHIKTLIRSLETFADTEKVTSPVLKCIAEIVFNRASRVIFGPSSANGILLFREASAAVTTYGSRMLTYQPVTNKYAEKYKGIAACLDILTKSLEGGYVNFGVFALYNDPALRNAMDMMFQLVLNIPVEEIMAYPKFSMSYLKFLQTTFRSHIETVLELPTPAFMAVIQALRDGLDSIDLELSTQAASALDFLASYYVRNAKKDTPPMTALRLHVSANVAIFELLMKVLFQIVVFGEAQHQWSLSRPMLSLILAAELVRPDAFEQFKLELIQSQPMEFRERMQEEIVRLMKDVTQSLDITNRDRFAQRLTTFRQNVREFAKM